MQPSCRWDQARRLAAGITAAFCISFPCAAEIQTSVYVPRFLDGAVSVIDSGSNAVVASVTAGAIPFGVAITPDGRLVYVTNINGNSVTVIDAVANSVTATIPIGGAAYGVATTPNGKFVYVANATGNSVSVIDTTTNTPVGAAIPVGSAPIGIALAPNGGLAYVTNFSSNTVSVIDTTTNTVIGTPIPVGSGPRGVIVTPDGGSVYVSNQNGDTVSVIDAATRAVVASVPVGLGPRSVAVTPDGKSVFVTNYALNSVSVIDTATRTVKAHFAVGSGPYGVAITPDGKFAYVTNQNSNTVSVIDTATNRVIGAPIEVVAQPVAFGSFVGPNIIIGAGGPVSVASDAALTALGFGQFVILNGGTLRTTGNLITSRTISLLAQGGKIDTNGFNLTLSGTIVGSGDLAKLGTGTLNLTGMNTYSGDTTVSGGSLIVNGSIANSTTIVNAGGTLGGTGTVGTVNVSGGRVAPGNSIGTINVAGNVAFSGGGVYEVEVDAAGNSDRINATGTATLPGGRVHAVPAPGNYITSTNYTILTANGGLIGTFDCVSCTLAYLTPSLSYDANNVFLTLTRNTLGFSDVTETPNQHAVSTTLDTLYDAGTPALTTIFNHLLPLTVAGANSAFDSLSGVQHTHAQALTFNANRQFQGLLIDRLRSSRRFFVDNSELALTFEGEPWAQQLAAAYAAAADVDAGRGSDGGERSLWFRGLGGFGEIDSTANASGTDYGSAGVAVGLDRELRHGLLIGAAFGYVRTEADTDAGRLDVDSYQLAAYGRWSEGGNYVDGIVGGGLNRIQSSRDIAVGIFTDTATADYDTRDASINLEVGHRFELRNVTTLTPFVGLDYTHLDSEDFTEAGAGAADLTVDDEEQDSLRSALGMRLGKTFTINGDVVIHPMVEAAWVHEYLDNESRITAGFAAAPEATFRVAGVELDRDRARIGAGVSAQLANSLSLDFRYRGEIAGSDASHSFAATLQWRF